MDMAEKPCLTLPFDRDNMLGKCPCCGSPLKLIMTWKSEGLQFEIVPVVSDKDSAMSPNANNSLMNIVSVASTENRLKDTIPAGKSFPQLQDNSDSHLNHNNSVPLNDDSDDATINNSNSSSLSTDHAPRIFSSSTQESQFNASPAMPLPFRKQHQELQQSHLTTTTSRSLTVKVPKIDQTAAPPNYDLIRHQVTQSSTQETRIKCEINQCPMTFANIQQLDLHYKEHKGEKIQKCDWEHCDRLFSSKEKLRNHIRCRHTNERPFQCADCDKAFTSPKHLKDHRLLHTDERPYACDWDGCDLRFRRRHHLVAHKRVHTKERPYDCQYPGCEMKFTKSHHVKRHFETHFKYRTADQSPAAAAAVLLSSITSHPSPAVTMTAGAAVSPASACSPIPSALLASYAFPAL